MGYDNLGLEYLGKTKQEIEEIEARKDKSFRQVLEPIGNTINFIGDALDTVDKEAGILGTDIDVYHARQLLSVQPARQLGQELGKSRITLCRSSRWSCRYDDSRSFHT